MEKYNKKQLINECKKLGIKGYSKKNRTQLLELLKVDDKVDSLSDKDYIDKLLELIKSKSDERIKLLRDITVLQWIFGDTSFLNNISKNEEDIWGRNILKIKRPDLKLDKQWTNKFGEHICEEIYYLMNENIKTATKKENYNPDLETDKYIIEVKTQTYYTIGTAGEKILGCPFKYAEIPELYSKPLRILCIGGAEKISREQYGNLLGSKCSKQKKRILDFYKSINIEFISATEMLKALITN